MIRPLFRGATPVRVSKAATVFIDIEASSLHRGSFPVEIGWCSQDIKRGWSATIRPCPGWTEWSYASERTHGLALATLTAKGDATAEVMRRLNADLAGTRCISDSPNHDTKWLFVLARGCGIEPAFVIDTLSLDALLVSVRRHHSADAPNADSRLAAQMAEEAGLIAHHALDDAVMHALRLAAVAIAAEAAREGEDRAEVARCLMIERTRDLVQRAGRHAMKER